MSGADRPPLRGRAGESGKPQKLMVDLRRDRFNEWRPGRGASRSATFSGASGAPLPNPLLARGRTGGREPIRRFLTDISTVDRAHIAPAAHAPRVRGSGAPPDCRSRCRSRATLPRQHLARMPHTGRRHPAIGDDPGVTPPFHWPLADGMPNSAKCPPKASPIIVRCRASNCRISLVLVQPPDRAIKQRSECHPGGVGHEQERSDLVLSPGYSDEPGYSDQQQNDYSKGDIGALSCKEYG